MAPMIGVIRSATSEVTTAPNAVPMTTATASSTMLPREMKFLKPASTAGFYQPPAAPTPPGSVSGDERRQGHGHAGAPAALRARARGAARDHPALGRDRDR